MICIVTYDIRFSSVKDPKAVKRLIAISKLLENYGLRRQKSLFECLISAKDIPDLKDKIMRIIDRKRDSVCIYPLCGACLPKTIIQGIGEVVEIKPYIII